MEEWLEDETIWMLPGGREESGDRTTRLEKDGEEKRVGGEVYVNEAQEVNAA